MFSSSLVVLLGLSTSALASVFVTSPVASTTFTAGQSSIVSWQDDGTSPSLAQFGPSIISIYAGNALEQTLLQTIAPSVDVSAQSSLTFTPDPTIGPDSNEYFVRFQSISLKDATNPQYPALAFSAKFTMAGMTGNFTAAVQSEINGQSTAPLAATSSGPSTAGATSPVTTSASSTSSAPKSTGSGSATHSSSSASSSASAKKDNGAVAAFGAGPVKMWLGVLLGVAVGVMVA